MSFPVSNQSEEIDLYHAMQDFLIHLKAAGRSSSTISCYLHDLELLMRTIGNMRLSRITDRHLEKAVICLREFSINGAVRTSISLNRIKSAYRSFFKWAFESGRVPRNAAARLYLAKTKSRPTIPITMKEIISLLDTIRISDDPLARRDEALFAVYAFTGIRRSEALALRIKDYDRVSSTLFLWRTKGGSNRMQPVPLQLAEILAKYIRRIERDFKAGDYSPLFFGRHPEKPLSARQAQVRFEKWKNFSGIRKDLTIHSFRAGFATLLYEATGDILLVSHAMGHVDIQTTKRYINNNMYGVRQAIEKIFSQIVV
ncbi:MAG: tyrosine-type recombinase/integrase [Nitrospiraceae bacterium]|nr:tyrosine-type recombinase/integrase [Nitrospirota bacterium]MDA8338983.1 tyrosine-type recombinase/integrase [Nitrospiraceae bacterium]